MAEHVIVWDLETVPDLDALARAHYLPEPAVEVAREVLGEKFPKLPFQQIVCIGAVVAEKVDGVWWVTAIGAPHTGECRTSSAHRWPSSSLPLKYWMITRAS